MYVFYNFVAYFMMQEG